MRLARFQRLGQNWEIPESTPNQYNFDPKIATFGQPKFDSNKTAGRISKEEFINLRAKVLQNIGSGLTLVRSLFYLRFITAFLSLAFGAFRLIMSYIHGYHIPQSEYFIFLAIIIVPNFIVNYTWRSVSKKTVKKIQTVLDGENRAIYASREISWKISPNLRYMNIIFKNEGGYLPPHQTGNTVMNYPVNSNQTRGTSQNARENNQIQSQRGLPIIDTQAHRRTTNPSQYHQLPPGNINPQITYDFRFGDPENPQVSFNPA